MSARRRTSRRRLQRLDLLGLQAFLALGHHEADLLAFLQRLETAAFDRAKMHEHVLATFLADEAEALGVIEPFDGSGFTIRHGLLLATLGMPSPHWRRFELICRESKRMERWAGSLDQARIGPQFTVTRQTQCSHDTCGRGKLRGLLVQGVQGARPARVDQRSAAY